MTILFLSRFFYPHIGGVEKHIEKVSGELIKEGHQVMILTLKHDPQLPETETNRGIKIIRLPYPNSKFTLWKNIWSKRLLIKQADIVHCHDVFFWYLPFRFLFPKKPVYTTFHGWEGEFPIPYKNILVRKLSEKLSSGNICVGAYIKKYYGTKPDYITYGGVNLTSKHTDRQAKIKDCLFIGRLEKDLGLDEYLKTFKTIKKKHKLKITFIGDGQYKKQCQKLGRVTGLVKSIQPYLKKPAYVFASSYLTILEAMAAGQPIFALYQNPLKKDYLTQFPGAKYMHISGSADELVGQFQQVVSQPQKTRQMVKSAQAFARQQTWAKVTNLYLKLWQKT